MRFSLRVACLLALALHISSCATNSSNDDGSSTPSELESFGENEFNSDSSTSTAEQSPQDSTSAGQEEDLSLDDDSSSQVAQESTQSIEDELTLDEDKSSAAPEDLQAFEEPPLEQDAMVPPPEIAQETPPPAVEPPPPQIEEPPMAAPVATSQQESVRITDLEFHAADKGGTVLIKTSAPAQYTTRHNESENQYVIEVENAVLPAKFKRPYITKDFTGSIASINAYQDAGSTTARFVIQMRDSSTIDVQQNGTSLAVASSSSQDQIVASNEADSSDSAVESTGTSTFDEFLTGETKFYGRKINIEVTDEDVRNVFNFIAEESGANLVLDEKVAGPVTVKLRQVPWDQALVVVMKSKGLGYVRQGNVLRIAPLDALKRESDAARDIVEARQKVDPLRVKVIPVNYANVEELVKQIEKFLSARGKVGADNRTSSIVLTDTAETIERITRLIKNLDVAPDQVLIEGKIVEAKDSFSRDIGVRWGAGNKPISMGNSNSGLPLNLTPSLGMNSGMNPTTSGLNLNLNVGTLDILGDLTSTLSLYEKEELVKVVSSPRVVTMNREKSAISQSDQLPVQQTSTSANQNLITYQYITAELKLQVTPQITPDAGVIMDIDVKREFFGAVQGSAPPAKFARQAQTRVLVQTGQTAVIGGIYNNDQSESEGGVPYLRKIPVLGWLFKSRARKAEKNELIIFLTPRVLSKAEAQGGVE